MIGLRARTFSSTAEFLALGPVWPGTAIRGITISFTQSGGGFFELALVVSGSPDESEAALQQGRSLIGPGDELLGTTEVAAVFLASTSNVLTTYSMPFYFPVVGGVAYILLGLRSSTAAIFRASAGLTVEVERQVGGLVRVGGGGLRTSAKTDGVVGLLSESATLASGPRPVFGG